MDSTDWIETYRSQGFALVRGVFGPADVEALRGAFDAVLEKGRRFQATAREGLTEYRVVPIAGKPTF